MTGKTIESKAAETITQQPVIISIDGKDYQASPPSLATLCQVSRLVSLMPDVSAVSGGQVFATSLRVAKDCAWLLAEICARLVLGAKRFDQALDVKEAKPRRGIRSWLRRRAKNATRTEPVSVHSTEGYRLTEACYYSLTPSQLRAAVYRLLSTMEIGDFFGLTASLSEANLLKPGGAEETAPGD